MSYSNAEEEGSKYIGMLNLEAKKNVNVTTLSGGMKRKVNLGIALIGNSKVGEYIPMMMLTTCPNNRRWLCWTSQPPEWTPKLAAACGICSRP